MRFRALLQRLLPTTELWVEGEDPEILGVAPLDRATAQDLSFLENPRFYGALATTQAGAVLVGNEPQAIARLRERQIPFAQVPQPRLAFAQAIALFHPPQRPQPGIHPTAVLGEGVQVGRNVFVGPRAVIGDRCHLADDVVVHAGTVLYADVTVGARTVIHANGTIHAHTVLGADCLLHSGVVVGDEGFGFVPTPDGTWYKMPQVGRVVLGDRVEVGSNSTIDRGSLQDTVIGAGTKIDNLVQIGHGCRLGENCLLAGQVGLAGGAELGKNVTLGGQVGVSNHIQVGEGVMAAAKTGIASDVAAHSQVMGYPAIPLTTFRKASAIFRRLPEIYKLVKQLTPNDRDLEPSEPQDR
ncbi:MAG: UDP-3-O-(3-hydroxymyristoyl)glucosamine N-acyltransferase [Oscillatoriales cyanobacterium SM2_1_8]|nr:UDP-3-O-(3-hydroxymyristoyl)glucosamine N-acyltransferase [Oscillatoriales cyanobacterium SM2_1_8]